MANRNNLSTRPPHSALLNVFSARLRQFFRNRAEPLHLPTPDDPGDPRQFTATSKGSGIFGKWILDKDGLPAYDYTLDQHKDPRAHYQNSEDLDRRDHWYIIGNDRITGLASNDGVVQVYLADRGGIFLNHYDLALELNFLDVLYTSIRIILSGIRRWLQSFRLKKQDRDKIIPGAGQQLRELRHANRNRKSALTPQSYVGGFAYIDNGTEVWPTAYRYRPDNTEVSRVYGIGYFETQITHAGISVQRKVYAPPGNDPVLIADVSVTNTTDQPQDIRYYEYWDVNIYQMKLQWIRTGAFAPGRDAERRALNGLFETKSEIQPEAAAIRFHQATPLDVSPREQADPTNWYPPDVFLADLSGTPDEYYRYTDDFFGRGNVYEPDAVAFRRDRNDYLVSGSPMPYCMVIRSDLHLEPGQTVPLRFAYGAANRDEQTLDFLQPYRTADLQTALRDHWRKQLAYFSIGSSPAIQREIAWNAYSLLASTIYNEYFDVHLTPQGSAYLFLHGADGVPRDYALFAMTLSYLRPALAKDLLRMQMQMRSQESKQIAYAVSGHGYLDGGDVHDFPSDLDLFFLMAIHEYLSATGDIEFLNEPVRLYSANPSSNREACTVLEHILIAVEHLMKDVGRGQHGLLRVRSGDWSDGVVVSNVLTFPPRISLHNSVANGESIPNTQMALYVLPRTALLLEAHHPELAAEIRQFVTELENAVRQQWQGQWYNRVILRDYGNQPVTLGSNAIDLESQPWALISGLAERQGVLDTLIDSIDTLLDRDSPIGAPLMPRGAVWPAISQLLTWGYAKYRPELAWRSFYRNTFLARASAFPDIWFNIWSGPDGVNCVTSDSNAGGTWVSPVTPVTDFPAMNNNQHSMSLLGLLRVCGIEPLPDTSGLQIAPLACERYALDFPLLKLDVSADSISGEYRPVVNGSRVLKIKCPTETTAFTTLINGETAAPSIDDGFVVLDFNFAANTPVQFEIQWRK